MEKDNRSGTQRCFLQVNAFCYSTFKYSFATISLIYIYILSHRFRSIAIKDNPLLHETKFVKGRAVHEVQKDRAAYQIHKRKLEKKSKSNNSSSSNSNSSEKDDSSTELTLLVKHLKGRLASLVASGDCSWIEEMPRRKVSLSYRAIEVVKIFKMYCKELLKTKHGKLQVRSYTFLLVFLYKSWKKS